MILPWNTVQRISENERQIRRTADQACLLEFQTNSSFLPRLPLGAALVGLGTQNASFYDDLLIR